MKRVNGVKREVSLELSSFCTKVGQIQATSVDQLSSLHEFLISGLQ